MLNEMEKNDPYKPKISTSAASVNGRMVTLQQDPPAPSNAPRPPGIPGPPVPTKSVPRITGYCPVKAPMPQVAGPTPQVAGTKPPGAGPTPQVAGPKPPGAGAKPPGAGAKPPGAGPKPPGAGPKPPGAGPKPQIYPPPAPWVNKQQSVSVSVASEPRPSPQESPRPGVGAKVAQTQETPPWKDRGTTSMEQKAPRNGVQQTERAKVQPEKELGAVRADTGRGDTGRGDTGRGDTAPLSFKDVEELEKLATQFMLEMDKQPKISTRPTGMNRA
ncbi:uncharacterized protein LOC144491224 isoform X4 [Mustelus asterias]